MPYMTLELAHCPLAFRMVVEEEISLRRHRTEKRHDPRAITQVSRGQRDQKGREESSRAGYLPALLILICVQQAGISPSG